MELRTLNMITPLELLNLYLSDGKSVGPTESKLYQKFNSELTWDALLNEGYQQDLAPMLYYIITKSSVFKTLNFEHRTLNLFVSDEIQSKLKDLYNHYLVRNMIQFKELDTILDAFEKEGVDVIQLKGAWIAKNYYPDPALRPMGDLDLLVRKEDLKRAKECLVKNGYELAEGPAEDDWEKRHFHFPYIKNTQLSPTLVELHFDIRAKSDLIKSNILELWKNATLVNADREHIFTLSSGYLLLHLFWHTYLHLSKDLSLRLLYLIDIALIQRAHNGNQGPQINSDAAKKWGIQKQVYFTMDALNKLFNIHLNTNLLEKLRHNSYYLKIFDFLMLKKEKEQTSKDMKLAYTIILNLIAVNSIFDKIKLLLTYNSENPFSNRERIKKKYSCLSVKMNFLLFVLHPVILLIRGLKGFYKLLRKPISHTTQN